MAPSTVLNALVITAERTSRMIGPLHTLYYHWEMLSPQQRAAALKDARESAEDTLRAIQTAEHSQAILQAAVAA